MTYFVVLGKSKDLSLKELELIDPQDMEISGNIAIFETQFPDKLNQLAGITKFGDILPIEEAEKLITGASLVGTKNQEFGVYLKKNFGVKRFKTVDEISSDLEVKEKGIEVFNIDKEFLGIVKGYQNIDLYENIDFKKPQSGMQIGMMPSKLAHIMINIGLSQIDKGNITIYDPFVGFGTTGFLANALGYDFIGSDINTTIIKPNLKRRKESNLGTDKKITVFKHDVNSPFEKNFLKNVDMIISEGRLGPVANYKTQLNELRNNVQKIRNLYSNFIDNTNNFWDKMTMCISIPVYLSKNETLIKLVLDKFQSLGWDAEHAGTYQRPGQTVGRAIILAQK